jgi:hypothetical protein
LRLAEKVERNIFTTIIEVFPPNFSAEPSKEPLLGLRQKTRDLVARVRKIEHLADAILVADVKDLSRLKLSSIYTAAILKQELGIEVIPVITARDMNRAATRTTFLTSLAYGLDSVMLVWGDRYGVGDTAKNVYDFRSLAEVIAEMRFLAERADHSATILAPVDVLSLATERGLDVAKGRIEKGADCLLAQPPTSDTKHTVGRHLELLDGQSFRDRVFLNVFPFRDREDIQSCRTKFGWRIPEELDKLAADGEPRLLKEAKAVVESLRERRLPGVYVSTRGRPELARFILD